MHDAGTEAGELQHFVVRNLVELSGIWYHARIGRIDSLHVGIDLDPLGLKGSP